MNKTWSALLNLMTWTAEEHATHYRDRPSKGARFWNFDADDLAVALPYAVHPTWAAISLLTDTTVPEDTRILGAFVLVLHDILEDTTLTEDDLYAYLTQLTTAYDIPIAPQTIFHYVQQMTFTNTIQEWAAIWQMPDDLKLLKLYDKVSTILDSTWMSSMPGKRELFMGRAIRLASEVQQAYGTLNIIQDCHQLTKHQILPDIIEHGRKPLFLLITGISGSGKTTAYRSIAEWLNMMSIRWAHIDDIGGLNLSGWVKQHGQSSEYVIHHNKTFEITAEGYTKIFPIIASEIAETLYSIRNDYDVIIKDIGLGSGYGSLDAQTRTQYDNHFLQYIHRRIGDDYNFANIELVVSEVDELKERVEQRNLGAPWYVAEKQITDNGWIHAANQFAEYDFVHNVTLYNDGTVEQLQSALARQLRMIIQYVS